MYGRATLLHIKIFKSSNSKLQRAPENSGRKHAMAPEGSVQLVHLRWHSEDFCRLQECSPGSPGSSVEL
eukprot:14188516-Alexandrium_andersonii.AAC.1